MATEGEIAMEYLYTNRLEVRLEDMMRAQGLKVSLLGVGTVLRLEGCVVNGQNTKVTQQMSPRTPPPVQKLPKPASQAALCSK